MKLMDLAKDLRKYFPTNKPVRIRVCQVPYSDPKIRKERDYGDCQDKGKYYLIRINKKSSLSIKMDTLMHEWAHCLADWDEESDSHSDKWGKYYARIYRKMVD